MGKGALHAAKSIVPAVAGSMVLSYVFWDLTRNRKIFGGENDVCLPGLALAQLCC